MLKGIGRGLIAAVAVLGIAGPGIAADPGLTDTEIVIEGRSCGKHVSEFLGFLPTGRDVELPFVAFYRFDASGKLTSERVVMNLGPLRG